MKKVLIVFTLLALTLSLLSVPVVPGSVKTINAQVKPQLYLKNGTPPKIKPGKSYEDGLYIVQFKAPVKAEWKSTLAKIGVSIGDYVPDYAFIVKANGNQLKEISKLPYVSAVYEYPYEYRISKKARGANDLLVKTLAQGKGKTYRIKGKKAEDVFKMDPFVSWVEAVPVRKLYNDVAAQIIEVDPTAWSYSAESLTGKGQIVGIADTGVDTGDMDTLHPDLKDALLKVYALGRTNDWSDPAAHGTHVFGSVAGRGVASDGKIKGMAPEAQVVFQSVLDSRGGLGGLPNDLNDLFITPYQDGARIHTNSWGCPLEYCGNAYDTESQQVDEFTWNYSDMTILFAAGNDGYDYDNNKVVYDSVTPPSTAKNCITVGASESYRVGNPYIPDDYEFYADNINEIALFSSRGWTSDGRIKPDVVAPGTWILSVKSQVADDSEFWPGDTVEGDGGDYAWMGGTSMATPITAGFVAVVRQYLQDIVGIKDPSSSLIKALLIATAKPLGDAVVSKDYGWGRISMDNILNGNNLLLDESDTTSLNTGDSWTYTFDVKESGNVKVVLVWRDYPGSPEASKYLVNDLDLQVTTPNGTSYYGNYMLYDSPDRINNVEVVYLPDAAVGTYTIKVTGYNVPEGPQPFAIVVSGASAGSSSSDDDNSGEDDTQAPSVSITSPEDGSTLSGNVTVTVSASDNVGVSKVELYVNDDLYATDTTSPYEFVIDTSKYDDGEYTITAKAYDSAGNSAESSIKVTFSNSSDTEEDNVAPSVTITSPDDGSSVRGSAVYVYFSVSDNVGVKSVEVYVDGSLYTSEEVSDGDYYVALSLTRGWHTITVKAYDAAGNVGEDSISIYKLGR
ncbi:S8 family serine peptidase [bacterium 3DAC]|nr:S8 family serine peptidase [bacterium 3DAC]